MHIETTDYKDTGNNLLKRCPQLVNQPVRTHTHTHTHTHTYIFHFFLTENILFFHCNDRLFRIAKALIADTFKNHKNPVHTVWLKYRVIEY